jgi:hypothetical protein
MDPGEKKREPDYLDFTSQNSGRNIGKLIQLTKNIGDDFIDGEIVDS